MGLKERIVELICGGDLDGLRRLAAADSRVTRHLVGRLWDPQPERRHAAAVALGAAAAARPDQGRDLLRRLMWALNDESATHGVHAVPAFAEISSAAPGIVTEFVGPLVTLLGDSGLREAVLVALVRMAEARPELIRPHLERIRRTTDPGSEPALMARLEELLQEGEPHDE